MPADLTREAVARAIFEKRWPGRWNNHAFLHQQDQAYDEADAVLQTLSEPARLAAARAEGVREGIEMARAAVRRAMIEHPGPDVSEDYVDGVGRGGSLMRRAAMDAITAISPSSEPTGGTAEPSAPVAAECASEATRYLERLIENAAPPPTRPLYGDLIGLCTQVDNLLCYVREQGKDRITALEAEVKALRKGLRSVVSAHTWHERAPTPYVTFDGIQAENAAKAASIAEARALLQGGPDAG